MQKGIKDLNIYKDRQGIVGEVANEMIDDVQAIIENAHGSDKNEILLDFGRTLLDKTDEQNRIQSQSEMLQTRKLENSELKIIYDLTGDICKAFCEILE